MSLLRWNDVQGDLEPDGALRDIYVHATDGADWQRVDLVRSCNWPSSYSEDGERVRMPTTVEEIFARRERVAVLWAITPTTGIHINCHFFTTEEIEFDLAPWEILGQSELDVVVEFVRAIGRVAGKPAVVCHENAPDALIMSYDPATDAVMASATRDTS